MSHEIVHIPAIIPKVDGRLKLFAIRPGGFTLVEHEDAPGNMILFPSTSYYLRSSVIFESDTHIQMRLKKWDIPSVNAFLRCMGGLDSDFRPFGSIPLCGNCGGLIWKSPILTPRNIKRLAKQFGIYLAIDRFVSEKMCAHEHGVEDLTASYTSSSCNRGGFSHL